MSVKVMSWVWENARASGNELLVLLAIADAANHDGREAWPSIRRLAEMTRLSQRTVQRMIRKLEATGQIRIRLGDGRGGANSYVIVMDDPAKAVDISPVPPSDCHPRQIDGGDTGDGGGVTEL